MRVTLHAVAVDDHPPFHDAMQETLRAARLNDRRFRATGLSTADADALVPEVLEFASQPRTNAEFDAFFESRFGPLPKPGPWWALRSVAPVAHAPTGGPWSFGRRPAYVAAPTATAGGRPGAVGATARVALPGGLRPGDRCRTSPSSRLMYRPTVRAALQALDGELVRLEGPDGVELFDVPGALGAG